MSDNEDTSAALSAATASRTWTYKPRPRCRGCGVPMPRPPRTGGALAEHLAESQSCVDSYVKANLIHDIHPIDPDSSTLVIVDSLHIDRQPRVRHTVYWVAGVTPNGSLVRLGFYTLKRYAQKQIDAIRRNFSEWMEVHPYTAGGQYEQPSI